MNYFKLDLLNIIRKINLNKIFSFL